MTSEIKVPTPARFLLNSRWGQLKNERASWMSHWKEISTYLLPRSGRFFLDDRNKGWRRHNNIYDSTGTRSLRVLAAGMMSGMTSPARPWFRLGTADPDLAKNGNVKVWLNDVTMRMRDVFAKSNTYRAFHSMYEELAAFGTAASIITADFNDIIHHYPLTTGEYCIATNWRGEVDTLYREFEMRVSSIVKEFGYDKCSTAVKNLYDRGSLDAWVTIIHAIEPRADRDPSKRDAKNMAWGSWYFESGGNPGHYLSESGYTDFPVIAPRWQISGGDIYGNSPGMEALGDIKQLQQEQLRKAQGIDYQTKPPLQVPSNLKNRDVDSLPGGITFVDAGPNTGIRTMFESRIDLNALLGDIQDVRERIRGSFYADLFLMISSSDDLRMTATEVSERHEEKLLMLGPVLERLQTEMLDPVIELTFSRMMQAGALPPPPKELQGQDLNVEYVSMLAQAQAAVGTNSVDRFTGAMMNLAQVNPTVLDKFNVDEWADTYSGMLGIDPNLIVATDKADASREARAKAQVQAQQAEQQPQQAAAAKSISQIDPQGLKDVMSQFTGYTTPQGA
jgi:hypothetical protein